MKIFAHRGLHTSHPENTLAAFMAAAQAGCDGIETDVRVTADGALVLLHDRTLDHTAVEHLSLAQLEQLVGHPLPTLQQALQHLPDIAWNIELKTNQALPEIFSILEQHHAKTAITVSSFCHDVVMQCAATTHLDCAFLSANRLLSAALAELCAYQSRYTNLKAIVWDFNIVHAQLLDDTRAGGLDNWVYGAVTAAEHVWCTEHAVAVLITDYPNKPR